MSLAAILRLAIGLGGGATSLSFALRFGGLAGWLGAAVGFVASGLLAEAAFRRLASADEIRADLADRVRNPPS